MATGRQIAGRDGDQNPRTGRLFTLADEKAGEQPEGEIHLEVIALGLRDHVRA